MLPIHYVGYSYGDPCWLDTVKVIPMLTKSPKKKKKARKKKEL